MKKRTVKLAIYPVKLPTSPRNVPMPDITALKTWLDATFGDQINAWFEVTYKPQTEYNYMSSDEVYGYMSSQYGTNTFSSMFNSISYTDIAYDIRILMVDLVAIASVQMHPTLPPFAIGAVGIANRGLNGAVILAGGSAVNYTLRSQQEVIETIAHEIGHIMIGFGHPDFVPTPLDIAMGETEKLTGPAPLEGTERQYRLMSSARVPGAKLLVKREWENAEEWLKINIK